MISVLVLNPDKPLPDLRLLEMVNLNEKYPVLSLKKKKKTSTLSPSLSLSIYLYVGEIKLGSD